MSKQTQSKCDSTITLGARLLILILIVVLLTSCGTVLQTPVPAATNNALTPTVEIPATQELSLDSLLEVLIDDPTVTLTPEPAVLPVDIQELMTIIGSLEDIDNLVLVPEQVFSDFYNKVFPTEIDLRINESNEHATLGETAEFSIPERGTLGSIQLLLMGGFTNKDGAYLLLGTEDQATQERVIVPVQFTFGYEGVYSTVEVQKDVGQTKKLRPEFKNSNPLDAYGLLEVAKEYFGKVVVIQIVLDYNFEIITDPNRSLKIEKYFWKERLQANNLLVSDPLPLVEYDLQRSVFSGRIIF